MQNGEVLESGNYDDLLARGAVFRDLVMAHKDVMSTLDARGTTTVSKKTGLQHRKGEDCTPEASKFNQLTKDEKKEFGNAAYLDYMKQANGFFYYGLSTLSYIVFLSGQMASNWWMASEVESSETNTGKLIGVYSAIGLTTGAFLFIRSVLIVIMGLAASRSFFNSTMDSLFSAPMSFFDSTPSGRILSRLSVDLSILDLDIPFSFGFSISAFLSALANLGMTSSVTWQILVIVVPMMYINRLLQVVYNLASARELMRINGTTKAPILNYFGEAMSGATTIRAFRKQEDFTRKILDMIDTNTSPFFHNFAAREWLIQRLESLWSAVLCSSALIMVILPPGTISPGFVGLVLSYGLSLNNSQVASVQNQCNLANMIISVERIKQYLSLPVETSSKTGLWPSWPSEGKVELHNLQIRYSADAPLVLRGITCTFESGQKVGVVGRTGSGKTTLISALFRIIDPAGGRILIDGVDIMTIGVTALRSRVSIIPQEPTLFRGTVRFNLDPFSKYTDQKIWEALDKCQLGESVREKNLKLESFVGDDGENWSVGERQLFCLARTLLKRSQILVLDEATASIDNTTDAVLQKVLGDEFGKCTTITVAHRIPTVVSSDMVLALEDGLLMEFDRPAKLLGNKSSLFCRLVAEYWSNSSLE
ncbi:ATP-binding cassette transporter, subfamily C, member 24, SmABCC24 [Selaginella moellendorffii]|uniref:ATP-binding cassette transporter, subfamily C, member 24, SmABCC24 n=1 Tax=Selaginella moellendorffii TaxID=88036 RepID=D8RCJ3_SELML|nr:ATP-binding cassette transporter, subfamily C, member 24, SmABCC24 [Selaginella moellendorffii]